MSTKIVLIIIAAAVFCSNLPVRAQPRVVETQIKLTEKQVEGFIAVQKAMSEVVENMAGQALSKRDRATYQAQLNTRARRHGFKNLAEYQAVAAEISSIIAGVDPQTKVFTDPGSAIQKELERLTADSAISDREKQKLCDELNLALKSAQFSQPNNVALVQKYYDKLDMTNLTVLEGGVPSMSTVVRTISE
jgi:hypothetical protein